MRRRQEEGGVDARANASAVRHDAERVGHPIRVPCLGDELDKLRP